MWHRIQHWFGWNLGQIVFFDRDYTPMVAFMCDTCGQLEGIHEMKFQRKPIADLIKAAKTEEKK